MINAITLYVKEQYKMNLSSIRYIGVNDHNIDLFEGQYPVPNGMSYNSYIILGEKSAVMDSVDARFTDEWLNNIDQVLEGKSPDYLIIQHMEPDHSGSILHFMNAYPDAKIVSSDRAFDMIKNFFGVDFGDRRITVGDGDTLSLGGHELSFVAAAMVHWPEVIMTYDRTEKVLFSADAFGTFGALDVEDNDWLTEARRYYIGIVGKYGVPVQTVLKKAEALDIQAIYPLHGPVLSENLEKYMNLYHTWSTYSAEEDGIVIAYTSVYGNTKQAVLLLAEKLIKTQTVVLYDLARCDMFAAIADAFRYSKLVLATTTYNGSIFPFMSEFISHLVARGFTNRTVAFIENGSWAPAAARTMKGMLEKSKNLTFLQNEVKIISALNETSSAQLAALADELCQSPAAKQEETPEKSGVKQYVCKVCGYVFEGESLPADFKCPICKKGVDAFEEVT